MTLSEEMFIFDIHQTKDIMKSTTLSVIFLCLINVFCFSQEKGPIEIEKQGLKKTYIQNGKVLDAKQFSSALKGYSESAPSYSLSSTTGAIGAGIFALSALYLGAGSLYYTLKQNQAINDNDLAALNEYEEKSTAVIVVGAAGIVVGLPFFIISQSSLKKSINIYNSQFNSSFQHGLKVNVGIVENGLGFQMIF